LLRWLGCGIPVCGHNAVASLKEAQGLLWRFVCRVFGRHLSQGLQRLLWRQWRGRYEPTAQARLFHTVHTRKVPVPNRWALGCLPHLARDARTEVRSSRAGRCWDLAAHLHWTDCLTNTRYWYSARRAARHHLPVPPPLDFHPTYFLMCTKMTADAQGHHPLSQKAGRQPR